MKGKSLLSIAIASSVLLSAPSFALEIYKGHVISHKEWTTGNAKTIFKNANADVTQNKLLKDNASYSGESAYSTSESAKGVVGTMVGIPGKFGIYLSNQTKEPNKYTFTFSVCTEVDAHNMSCSYYSDEVQLEAGGYLSAYSDAHMQMAYANPGVFKTYIASYVSKFSDSTDAYYANASSSSANAVTITAN